MRSYYLSMPLITALACGSDVTIEPFGGRGGGVDVGGATSLGGASSTAGAPPNGGSTTTSPGVGGFGAGGPGAGGEGGAVQVCADFGTECTQCVAVACPADWCGCAESMECLAIFGCFDECQGDPDCNQGCFQQHQDGASAAILVSSCAGGPCAASCPEGGEPLEPCGQCILQSCDDATNACFAAPPCFELWTCLIECADLDLTCQQGCYDDFGDGARTLEAVLDCTVVECPDVCN
jgi:hypothetical protein